jgi:hypothetical protein
MTPEERFTKMENLLHGMMEHQSRQQEHLDKQSAEINKQNAGIRDLVVVSRMILSDVEKLATSHDGVLQAFLTSQKEVTRQILENTEQIKELRKAQAEAQAATDEKLNILIDTVDRIIRALGKDGTK